MQPHVRYVIVHPVSHQLHRVEVVDGKGDVQQRLDARCQVHAHSAAREARVEAALAQSVAQRALVAVLRVLCVWVWLGVRCVQRVGS